MSESCVPEHLPVENLELSAPPSPLEWSDCLGSSTIGFAIVDEAQRVIRANRAFEISLGDIPLEQRDTLPAWVALFSATSAKMLQHVLNGREATSLQIHGANQALLVVHVAARRGATRMVAMQEIPCHAESPLQIAQRDPLTGLGNRLSLKGLGRETRVCSADESAIAVTIVDLDRFKTVNDTLGHPAGDTLLKLVAKRLRSIVRGEEAVIRLGGDEFVIVHTNGLDAEGAHSVGQRVVDLIGRPFLVEGHQVNIGASVGIATSQIGVDDTNEMLKRADLALYEAKTLGRGMFHVFEQELADKAQQRRDFEVSLRRALGLRELLLHYQPQIDLSNGQITGFEALIRWNHPEYGMVSPGMFIPLAEEIGEIHAIGEWTIREACKEAASWPSALVVAVNVSALQFQKGDLVEIVRNALVASGLPPQRLEIEITESVLMRTSEQLLHSLWALREIGVGIAMDDFGTGYSSLSYLHRFPFSKLKIDQSFVQSDDAEKSGALVKSILGLGASLGLMTIAEGVETDLQYHTLTEFGCKSAQGYFISKPMPALQIASYLAHSDFKPDDAR